MLCQLKSCGKCGGDLVQDTGDWRCWQCGRYYYPKPLVLDPPLLMPDPEFLAEETGEGSPGHLGSRRAMKYIDVRRGLAIENPSP